MFSIRKHLNRSITIVLLLVLSVLLTGCAAAAEIDLQTLIGSAYNILFPVGLLISFGFILVAGYKFITSEGNPEKLSDAKEDLTAAIVGAIFILLSLAILRIMIKSFLGVVVLL